MEGVFDLEPGDVGIKKVDSKKNAAGTEKVELLNFFQ